SAGGRLDPHGQQAHAAFHGRRAVVGRVQEPAGDRERVEAVLLRLVAGLDGQRPDAERRVGAEAVVVRRVQSGEPGAVQHDVDGGQVRPLGGVALAGPGPRDLQARGRGDARVVDREAGEPVVDPLEPFSEETSLPGAEEVVHGAQGDARCCRSHRVSFVGGRLPCGVRPLNGDGDARDPPRQWTGYRRRPGRSGAQVVRVVTSTGSAVPSAGPVPTASVPSSAAGFLKLSTTRNVSAMPTAIAQVAVVTPSMSCPVSLVPPPPAELAIAISTARPTAPPICWPVVAMPEPMPWSAGCTPVVAAANMVVKTMPWPSESRNSDGALAPEETSWPSVRARTTVPTTPMVRPMNRVLRTPNLVAHLPPTMVPTRTLPDGRTTAKPVVQAEKTGTMCQYWAGKWASAPEVAMPRKVMPAPGDRLRLPNSRSGTMGAALRRSMTRNTAKVTTATASEVRTWPEPQPASGPCTRAKTNRVEAAVPVTAPGRSKPPPACGMSLGSSHTATTMAAPASSTLT